MESAAHTSSLALSLLRQSSPSSQSCIISPLSLNSAISIIHDGASGVTQKELANVLLNGSNPSDVTDYYSSLTLSLPSSNATGVAFKSANRFYIDDSISLKNDYQKHVEDKYNVEVKNLKLSRKYEAAQEINEFVEGATEGKIKNMVTAESLSGDAILVNALYFIGKWKYKFEPVVTKSGTFKGYHGERDIDFMCHIKSYRVNQSNDIGTLLIMPYKDEKYNFFFLMPKENSNLELMRKDLTGDDLVNMIQNANMQNIRIVVPKFKIESSIDAAKTLSELGIRTLFGNEADLSKISSNKFSVSQIKHNAVIEIDEFGTEAAAATVAMLSGFFGGIPPTIIIDRPFLFGILGNEHILFIGQFV